MKAKFFRLPTATSAATAEATAAEAATKSAASATETAATKTTTPHAASQAAQNKNIQKAGTSSVTAIFAVVVFSGKNGNDDKNEKYAQENKPCRNPSVVFP